MHMTCDALMNSARSFAALFRGGTGVSYTGAIMEQSAAHGVVDISQLGGNSLGQSRLAMSEVQICGIPKPSLGEVALTP
jgi:hypothetical protein